MRHDAALPGVSVAVESRVGAEDARSGGECQVEVGFAYIGAVAVDGFQRSWIIDGDGVRAIADEWAFEGMLA